MAKLIAFFTIVLLFTGCKQKSEPQKIVVDAGYSSYVNAFTSGVISQNSVIKVVLSEPQPNAQPGQQISNSIFEFTPAIKGVAYWADSQTIEFKPDNNMPSGQQYFAKFKLNQIVDVPTQFKVLEFGFFVIKQAMFVSFDKLSIPDNTDLSRIEVLGTVRTNDFVNPPDLIKCFTATQKNNQLEIIWEQKPGLKTHNFRVVGIKRAELQTIVKINYNGASIGADANDKIEVEIPAITDFKVIQVNTVTQPGLYFSVQFSDPVNANQDINGLIYLKSGAKLRYDINVNEIKVYPLQKLTSTETIIIDENILNINNSKLLSGYQKKINFNLQKPAIDLVGTGVIMPDQGNAMFPFKAINLKAVNLRVLKIYEHNIVQFFQVNQFSGNNELSRVGRLVYDGVVDLIPDKAVDYSTWNNFNIDLSSLITPEPGAIYRIMLSFERYQSLYPCSDTTVGVKPLKRRPVNFDEDAYFDDEMWFDGWYNYSDIDDPCSDSYYKYYNRSKSANLFVSNIGIIAKECADNVYSVTTTDLNTTKPISGIEIEAYNYQNILIGAAKTNNNGLVQFSTKGKPYLIIAKNGTQRGYLRVDNSSALSVSLYDVSGQVVDKGIKGFIYGERGVWRPGDSIYMSFMLEDKQNLLPETHPVIMELYDPLGKLYDKKVKNSGVKGLYSFKFKTLTTDITGSWYVKVIVGNSVFTKNLKIETIKPNRLSIDIKYNPQASSDNNIVANLNSKWLYGATAANLNATVEMNYIPVKTTFENFNGYCFDDYSKSFYKTDPVVASVKTNQNGQAQINLPFNKPKNTPGMLKLSFNTKVFEPGGDYSQDFTSVKYSPYKSYVGIKTDKGNNWLTAFDTEKKHTIALAAVDNNGNPLTRKVKVKLYKIDWNWWWETQNTDEISRYLNTRYDNLILDDTYTINDGKAMYQLSFPEPGWGRYLIKITDEVSKHSTSRIIYGSYNDWYNNSSQADNFASSSLIIETGKSEYNVGEQIELTIPSGGVGNIFVTVEKGDKIIDQMWVKALPKSTTFSITATSQMTPNIYISAVLIQPYGQTKNSLPIRLYGIVPVKVFDAQTKILPVINCNNVIKPESNFNITVSETNGNPMAYTLAVVDEGLLSLTQYKTPEAWPAFYSKESLRVRTWDMYQYVMGAITGKMVNILGIGGDEGLVYTEDAETNRFKPVVSYLGPFFIDKNKKQTHKVYVPNYIGAVRVMVVAGYNGAYGSANKNVEVKQPLMVLSTLPRVLGPSETFTVPVNVIALDSNINNVKVEVSTNNMLKPIGKAQKTVNFEKPGEQTLFFEFETARALGKATFNVTVSNNKHKAFEDVELDVRAPNPKITETKFASIEFNQKWDIDYSAFGINGSNTASIELSGIPNLNIDKQLEWLIQYPHGCIEQTTSAVFPQLFLGSFIQLSDYQKNQVRQNIIAAINNYKKFQLNNGAFAYWPGLTNESDWGTNYAGHFMVEAKNQGYQIPVNIFDNWLKYQKSKAASWERSQNVYYGRWGHDLSQAYRLYTLALAGSPDIGAMNRLRADNNLSAAGAWRLAAAYALAGRADVAEQLTAIDFIVEPYNDFSYSFGSDLRDMAMVLETMCYINNKQQAFNLSADIAKKLDNGWHSTQTRAFALLAMAKFFGNNIDNHKIHADIIVNGKKIMVESESPLYTFQIDSAFINKGNIQVTNKSENKLFVNFVQTGIPVEYNNQPVNNGLLLDIYYSDINGNPIDVTNIARGTDFKVTVNIKHHGTRDDYKEMALNMVFPSGWQIVNTRVSNDAIGVNNSGYTYQDIRDDRIYTYFNLDKNETKTYVFLLNATFAGKYYMPAIYCAPMYDESVKAIKPGQWVNVLAK